MDGASFILSSSTCFTLAASAEIACWTCPNATSSFGISDGWNPPWPFDRNCEGVFHSEAAFAHLFMHQTDVEEKKHLVYFWMRRGLCLGSAVGVGVDCTRILRTASCVSGHAYMLCGIGYIFSFLSLFLSYRLPSVWRFRVLETKICRRGRDGWKALR